MTCLPRCTCHTDRRNSRRCSRSRRNSTTCRSYRYHSRRCSRRRSHCYTGKCRSWSRSRLRTSRRRSHSCRRSCRHRTATRSSSRSCCCNNRRSWSRRHPNSGTCTHRCEQEGRTRQHTVLTGKRGLGGGRHTDQLPEQPDASCRRARPPSTSPLIAESCAGSGDESSALSSGGSTQPLDVESIIARWTNIAYCGPCI